MKVLQFIPGLGSGGAERLVVNIANELSKYNDVTVSVLQIRKFSNKDVSSKDLLDNIRRESLNKDNKPKIFNIWYLYKYIKQNKFDVVHTHISAINYIILASFLCRKTKFFATIHSEAKREAGGIITSLLRKFLFKRGLCIPVTISEESRTSFINFYKLTPVLVYNGCDSTFEPLLTNPFKDLNGLVFIHVARVNPIKNQLMLYKVFLKLINEGENIYLVHIGKFYDNKLSENLKKFSNDRILQIGEISNVRAYMQYADALCSSSKMEGMPMTFIEAFSVGLPIISTPVGGCKDMVIDGINGYLSNNVDENSYYTAIKKFINLSDKQKEEMHINSRASFSKYSIDRTVEKYYQLFKGR